jgi:hypothetical protein
MPFQPRGLRIKPGIHVSKALLDGRFQSNNLSLKALFHLANLSLKALFQVQYQLLDAAHVLSLRHGSEPRL